MEIILSLSGSKSIKQASIVCLVGKHLKHYSYKLVQTMKAVKAMKMTSV